MRMDLDKPALERITKRDLKKAFYSLVVVPGPAYAEASRRKAVRERAIRDYGWCSDGQTAKHFFYLVSGILGSAIGISFAFSALGAGVPVLSASAFAVGIPWGAVNSIGVAYTLYYDGRRGFHQAGKVLTKASNKTKRSLAKVSNSVGKTGPGHKIQTSCRKVKDSTPYRIAYNSVGSAIKRLADLSDLGL
ncbi:MAG: hypothetical protein PHE27_03360 [Alphaproteobacteria bacterium]|nr:hypothetical protein [Alphaproteobacteria bacterium]